MPVRQILPLSGAAEDVGLIKTNLVNAVIHLFDDTLTPSPTTVKADLVAAECDFDDYTSQVIAAWTGPVLAPISGWQINAPVQTWTVVTNVITDLVGGYWIETAGGVVHDIFVFDQPVPMTVPGQSVQVVPVELVSTQG